MQQTKKKTLETVLNEEQIIENAKEIFNKKKFDWKEYFSEKIDENESSKTTFFEKIRQIEQDYDKYKKIIEETDMKKLIKPNKTDRYYGTITNSQEVKIGLMILKTLHDENAYKDILAQGYHMITYHKFKRTALRELKKAKKAEEDKEILQKYNEQIEEDKVIITNIIEYTLQRPVKCKRAEAGKKTEERPEIGIITTYRDIPDTLRDAIKDVTGEEIKKIKIKDAWVYLLEENKVDNYKKILQRYFERQYEESIKDAIRYALLAGTLKQIENQTTEKFPEVKNKDGLLDYIVKNTTTEKSDELRKALIEILELPTEISDKDVLETVKLVYSLLP
ncbi:hypothetical protein B6U93_00905 [Candidatus Woesearchaeota archaeon ex4484_78]|nr:MAG: hypothetical protein B6U93_00905 [Candidatus Woesearchaeota archaeon ex4484_78]